MTCQKGWQKAFDRSIPHEDHMNIREKTNRISLVGLGCCQYKNSCTYFVTWLLYEVECLNTEQELVSRGSGGQSTEWRDGDRVRCWWIQRWGTSSTNNINFTVIAPQFWTSHSTFKSTTYARLFSGLTRFHSCILFTCARFLWGSLNLHLLMLFQRALSSSCFAFLESRFCSDQAPEERTVQVVRFSVSDSSLDHVAHAEIQILRPSGWVRRFQEQQVQKQTARKPPMLRPNSKLAFNTFVVALPWFTHCTSFTQAISRRNEENHRIRTLSRPMTNTTTHALVEISKDVDLFIPHNASWYMFPKTQAHLRWVWVTLWVRLSVQLAQSSSILWGGLSEVVEIAYFYRWMSLLQNFQWRWRWLPRSVVQVCRWKRV